jgi:hypothetical protein
MLRAQFVASHSLCSSMMDSPFCGEGPIEALWWIKPSSNLSLFVRLTLGTVDSSDESLAEDRVLCLFVTTSWYVKSRPSSGDVVLSKRCPSSSRPAQVVSSVLPFFGADRADQD